MTRSSPLKRPEGGLASTEMEIAAFLLDQLPHQVFESAAPLACFNERIAQDLELNPMDLLISPPVQYWQPSHWSGTWHKIRPLREQ